MASLLSLVLCALSSEFVSCASRASCAMAGSSVNDGWIAFVTPGVEITDL